MLRKHFLRTLVGLLALAWCTRVFARGQFWDFLGGAQVDTSQVHGRIEITRHDGHFRTIQLRVSGEGIFFERLVVHFADGSSQELMISGRISREGGNDVINLLGERSLESIDLWYYKEPQGRTPRVTLYGARSPQSDGRDIAQQQ
jgi:hypothetical protein